MELGLIQCVQSAHFKPIRLVSEEYVEIQSRSSGDYWIIKRVNSKWKIYHKHNVIDTYHEHDVARTVQEAIFKIIRHDNYKTQYRKKEE